ncbi:MAG: transposase [Polyangiaceae bacterium]|nr:transposase [Polyangiaceae bacterium]
MLGYDRKLCAEVVSAFMAEVDRSLRWRAKRQLGLASVADAHTGGVAAVQRTDSALRLNVHFHSLVLDGVYVHENDDPRSPLEFRELDTPTRTDIAEVAARTAARVEKLLRAHGKSLDPELVEDTPPELALDEPGLAACYAAAAQGLSVSGDRAGQPPLRLIASPDPPARPRAVDATDQPIAEVRGINIHAVQVVDGRDRRRVERLCKYITRPPVAQDRLERRADGKLELTFKKVWRDGTRALVFEPADLIPRLVAAVPPPRFHLLRYFGVLSSHSSRRRLVVPTPALDDATANKPPPARGDQLELIGDTDDAPAPRKRWAWLLAHVFAADVETCPRCSGPMRWAEVANTRAQITRLLAEHGLGPRAPPATRVGVSVPEQLMLGFGKE